MFYHARFIKQPIEPVLPGDTIHSIHTMSMHSAARTLLLLVVLSALHLVSMPLSADTGCTLILDKNTLTPINNMSTGSCNQRSVPSMKAAAASAEKFDWTPLSALPDSQSSKISTGCHGVYQEPANLGPEAKTSPNQAPLRLSADSVNFKDSQHIELKGNVEVYQGTRRLRSDQVDVDNNEGTVQLSGNVQVREPGLLLRGTSASLDNIKRTTRIEHAQYLVHTARARGGAARITSRSDRTVLLKEGSYTSCEPGHDSWRLEAGLIKLDPKNGFGKAKNARFHIRDIPVFYFPYVEFPIDSRRKTGLLWPTFSQTSNGGIDIATPVYLNLAPNYDATLVPRYINTHGWLTEVEMRYLNPFSDWIIGGAYLSGDEKVGDLEAESHPNLDTERWIGRIQESGPWNDYWSSWIDYQSVSDASYLRDLGTTGLDVRREVQLQQSAGIRYNGPNWSFQTMAEDYKALVDDADVEENYTLAPRFTLHRQQNQANFQFTTLLDLEYSFFEHDSKPRAHRLYAEPGLSYPMNWMGGFLIPSVKLKHTHISLNDSNDISATGIVSQGDVDTTVNTFSFDSGLFLEREWIGTRHAWLQTLEPRLFYYYADFVDQSNLPVFDSDLFTFQYNQLFRENRFSSYDRIGDANHLSLGLTSRLYAQDTGEEVFSAGIGQILYFEDRRVSLNDNDLTATSMNDMAYKQHFRNASDIVGKLQWKPNNNWAILGNYIHDPYNKKTQEGGINLQFVGKEYNLFNIAYRYKRQQPVTDTLGKLINADTEQTDISTVIALNRQWSLFARWNYDMTDHHSIEDISGVEFDNCCWRARLVYQRERESFINDKPKNETDPLEYDFAVFLQIEFKGLGSVSDNVSALLSESIPGFIEREKNSL